MTHLHADAGIARLPSVVVAFACCLVTVETSFADPVTATDTLQFSTVDQGLFGLGKPINNLTFPPITLQNQTVGPATKGRIFENIPQDVPVEVLQAAWDQALATCQTERSRKIVNYCERYRFTPTQSQCETGNVTLPSSVTINCCTDFGIIDTNVTYPDCASGFGHLPGKADFSVSVPSSLRNFDLGAGIGPRPTEPAPQPFDVGVITTYEAKVNVGLELAIITDAGSVDVSYATKASLGADAGQVSVGQPFTLTVRHDPIADQSQTHMASKYPNINFVFQYFVDLLARLDVDYAHMGTDGQQKRSHESILFYSTANQPDADANGRLVGELVGAELGLTGAEVRIFANQPSGFPVDFPAGVIWDFPLAFGWEVTQPFTCPIAGIPKLGSYVCGPPPPLSTDVMELDLRTPALDTPAEDNFDGGVTDFASFTPVPVLRNELAADGSLTNTTPSAFRQILSVPGLGGFSSLDDILLDDGRLSTDWFRLDLDLDGLVSLYQGGANPLGGNFVFGGATKDPTTGENKSVANMEWNTLDIDYANWFHVDQTLKFEPKLELELSFSQAVQVRKSPADDYETVTQYTLTVAADADTTLEIIQPAGGVTITPTYSLRNNRFTNTTKMLWTPALQASFLQAKIEGIIANLLAAVLLPTDDDLNFAVAQATLSPPPVVMGPMGGTYSLEGFEDVSGTALIIGELPPGDLNNDGDVDRIDQSIFRSSLGKCAGDDGFIPETDYNASGCTDFFEDYRIWFGFYRDFSPPRPCNDCRPRSSRSLFSPPTPPVQPGHLSAGGTGTSASSCRVLSDGKIKCWGARPGDGSSSSGNAVSGPAVFVTGIDNSTAVSVGDDHTCAIDSGTVKCWGTNSFGQLGNGTNTSSNVPVTVSGISNATAVEAGDGFTCAIDGGLVKCWGENGGGQLGDVNPVTGATSNSNVPVTVSDLPSPATFLAAAERSPRICAILENEETWCWGTLPFFLGQNPALCSFAICRPVIQSIPPTTVALGRTHACYLTGSAPSAVECVGGAAGQFFSPLDQVLSFNHIGAGEDFNCGVDTDGIVWCWGLNNVRQLGDGTNNVYSYTTTRQAVGISNATDVAAGNSHTCAIDSGVVKCWGNGVATPTAVSGF